MRRPPLALPAALLLLLASGGAHAQESPCRDRVDRACELLGEVEKTGDVERARRAADLLGQAERACPDDPLVPFWRCVAEIYAKSYPGARVARDRVRRLKADRAVELNQSPEVADRDPHVLFLDAAIHASLGDRPDLAIADLAQLRRVDPRFMPERAAILRHRALLAWAGQLASRGRYEEAIRETQSAVREAGKDPGRRDRALRNLATLYRHERLWPEAQRIYEELAARYPMDGAILYALASAYADQLKFTRAAETWKRAVERIESGAGVGPLDAPVVADARLRYGVTLVDAERREDGRREIEIYAARHPEDARPWYYLGMVAIDLEEFDRAELCLVKAHRMDPICELTLKALQRLYTVFKPDEAGAKEATRLLEDETLAAGRKAELDRRKGEREDGTDGCR